MGGGPDFVILAASRIANSNRQDQSGSDDGNVIDWSKADEIILATLVGTSKGPIARQYRLHWRDTNGGSFVEVASTGEVKWAAAADTVLVDGTTLTTPLCSATPEPSWQNGLESEEDNTLPDSGTYSLADEYYTEFQWGLSLDDALGGHQYEFELYDITEGTIIGTCLAQITTYLSLCEPQTDSRIANASASWQGVCDANITGWDKDNEFILSTYAIGGDGTVCSFQLQFDTVLSPSGWDVIDNLTKIKYGVATVLVDKNTVANPAGCLTSTKSVENEGNSTENLIGMEASDIGEIQWALKINDAADDIEYKFRLHNVSDDLYGEPSCTIRSALAVAGKTLEGKLIDRKINPYINERIN